jgi:hypothetical protein
MSGEIYIDANTNDVMMGVRVGNTPECVLFVEPAPSPTPTPTITPTVTPTITPSVTPTPTVTPSKTVSNTPTPTRTVTPSKTVSNTPTPTVTPTITRTITPTPSKVPSSLLTGLVAYWPLEEASGTCYDSTANAYNLTNFGGGLTYRTGAAISTYAIYFYNSTSYAARGTGINALTGASFSCWVIFQQLPSTTLADQYIFRNSHLGSPYTCFDLILSYPRSNRWEFSVTDNLNGRFYLSSGTDYPSASTWYHIVCTVEVGGNMYLYINGSGTSYSMAAPTNNLLTVDDQTTLGNGYQGDTRGVFGTIDEPAFWNRALTSSEVDLLYNGGGGRVYPF